MSAANQAWVGALRAVARMQAEPDLSLPTLVCDAAGDGPALESPTRTLGRAALAARVAAVARWAGTHERGTVFALLHPPGPDYVALWLGIARAGCTAALIDPALSGPPLAHAFAAADCAAVIAQGPAPATTLPVIDPAAIEAAAPLPPPPSRHETALLLFTSGTTGLPKATRISHARLLEWALWFAGMAALGPEDRVYDCLPLHHATGGIVAVGAALVAGAPVWLAPGFSASRFWPEVAETGSTVVFYVGELCRYLADRAPDPPPHRVRLACGNGLAETVWPRFKARFAVPAILEFYAATESSLSLYNCDERPGALGRIPPWLAPRFPFAIVRLGPDGEPLRGPDGLCLPCAPGEPGEALGPAARFDGYTDGGATARKLLRDVLAPGDRWFRTGDAMRRDREGFVWFVDRLGDTYRWKGENVSTSQVAGLLRTAPGVADAVVYGIRLPGHDGRAPMAAIVPTPDFDPEPLRRWIVANLPAPAQPLFIRLCPTLPRTSTFKLPTAALAAEGLHGDLLLHDRRAATLTPHDPADPLPLL